MTSELAFIFPDWPAPARVKAVTTTRTGGVSRGPYASFNLGDRVGDDAAAVRRNREALCAALKLSAEPMWLRQVHGTHILDAAHSVIGSEGDGAWSAQPGAVCAVLTADCLPIFLCDAQGSKVAVLHAGWRGLAAGVIEQGVRAMAGTPEQLLVWLGPAIGPQAFEVGPEVRTAFAQHDQAAVRAFTPTRAGRYLADLYALARLRLSALGVTQIFGGGFCTFTDRERFYSYRRDGVCGRMASLIWLE